MNEYEKALFTAEVRRQQQLSDAWYMRRGQGWRVFNDMDALKDEIEDEWVEKLAFVSIFGTPRTIDFMTHHYALFPAAVRSVHDLWCGSCRTWKHKTKFSRDKTRGADRYQRRCKECRAEYARAARAEKRWNNGYRQKLNAA